MLNQINDLDPKRWKEYEKEGLQFTTIWDFPRRDSLNLTVDTIKGNSPVEIPRQCILRYTKENDIVVDPFVGSGTTLLVCAAYNRRGIGIELNSRIVKIAQKNLFYSNLPKKQINKQRLINRNAENLLKIAHQYGFYRKTSLVFTHPPYWNLMNYGKYYGKVEGDLSAKNFNEFLASIRNIFSQISTILKPGSFFCVLIGDCFSKGGKVIPLDYYLTKIALENDFDFHNKIIKITHNATSRHGLTNLMKYRSLKANFFICEHDYLLILQKKGQKT